jgi:hypothetical protein
MDYGLYLEKAFSQLLERFCGQNDKKRNKEYNCVKPVRDGIQFYVKCGRDNVTNFFEQRREEKRREEKRREEKRREEKRREEKRREEKRREETPYSFNIFIYHRSCL